MAKKWLEMVVKRPYVSLLTFETPSIYYVLLIPVQSWIKYLLMCHIKWHTKYQMKNHKDLSPIVKKTN